MRGKGGSWEEECRLPSSITVPSLIPSFTLYSWRPYPPVQQALAARRLARHGFRTYNRADGRAPASRRRNRFRRKGFGYAERRLAKRFSRPRWSATQEILTDPSYAGQIVARPFPTSETTASIQRTWKATRPGAVGYVIQELSLAPSNWRAHGNLQDYLRLHRVVGLPGVDTRALARHCRSRGTPKALISNDGTPIRHSYGNFFAHSPELTERTSRGG